MMKQSGTRNVIRIRLRCRNGQVRNHRSSMMGSLCRGCHEGKPPEGLDRARLEGPYPGVHAGRKGKNRVASDTVLTMCSVMPCLFGPGFPMP